MGRGVAKSASSKRASTKKDATAAPPPTPNRPRPPEPKRHKADKAEMLEYYRQMLLIRRFEERAGPLYGLGLIGGFCHLYIGQEARPAERPVGEECVRSGSFRGFASH